MIGSVSDSMPIEWCDICHTKGKVGHNNVIVAYLTVICSIKYKGNRDVAINAETFSISRNTCKPSAKNGDKLIGQTVLLNGSLGTRTHLLNCLDFADRPFSFVESATKIEIFKISESGELLGTDAVLLVAISTGAYTTLIVDTETCWDEVSEKWARNKQRILAQA